MASQERDARHVAVTATWVPTIGTAGPDDVDLAEQMRHDPLACIERMGQDRWPVQVTVRPALDLTAANPGLGRRVIATLPGVDPPEQADLFSGPALVRETLRRVAEADWVDARMLDDDTDGPPAVTSDGTAVWPVYLPAHIAHLRATAAVLAQLAEVAARLDPGRPDRDEWAAALSAVHALTPVDGEDDVPDADGSPLPDPALDHSSHSMQWVGGCPECPPALTPVSVEEQGDNR